jgi:hypothetical protein
LTGHPGEGKGGLRRAAARILGGDQIPDAEVAALLLPMVRRAVRTERGPAALVSWLRRCSGPSPGGDQTERAAGLAEGLARLLSDPFGSPADTLADPREHDTARPRADAP